MADPRAPEDLPATRRWDDELVSADAVLSVRPGGRLEVPDGARVTPLARDLLDERSVTLGHASPEPKAERRPRVRLEAPPEFADLLTATATTAGAEVASEADAQAPRLVVDAGLGYGRLVELLDRGERAAVVAGVDSMVAAWVVGLRVFVLGRDLGEGTITTCLRALVDLEAGWDEEAACSSQG